MKNYNPHAADPGGTLFPFADLSAVNGMPVLRAAREYHSRGLPVHPLAGKTPTLEGWPNLRLTEEELPRHFPDGRNIGIVLGGPFGLVDVDLDNPAAVAAAGHILPSTLTSGREKNPRSHYWFVCDSTPASRTYSVPKPMAGRLGLAPGEATLVELRSTGRQTAVAPSIHPEDGDHYTWHPGDIREIDGEELERLVQDVAVATLLALHWSAEGSRQAFVLAAAGYLGCRMGHDRVTTILEAAALAAEDEEKDKRSRGVRDTLIKLKEAR